jgi:phage gp36-like protein
MAYVTNEQIETRLGSAPFVQLTDDAGSGSADLAVVDAARQAAEGEADSYLARRYAVPIDVNVQGELSALLTGVVLDLVEYRLHARRPPIPPDVGTRRTAAVRWLEQVAAGAVDLPSAAALSPNPARGIVAAVRGDTRVLSRSELADV